MKTPLVVWRKELTELFRDFRSVLVSLLVPIVLFPLVFGVMAANLRNQADPTEEPIAIAIEAIETTLVSALEDMEQLEVVPTDNTEEALLAGEVEAAFRGADSGGYDLMDPQVEILYLPGKPRSLLAVELIRSVVEEVVYAGRRSFLDSIPLADLDGRFAVPVEILVRPLGDPARAAGNDFLAFLVPLLLIVATCISPLPSAADVGAGEKERGTLATLLVSPTNAASLLIGKLAAVSVMGILGTLSFGLGVVISIQISPDLLGIDEMAFALSPSQIATMVVFGIALALCFSAVELLLSLLAKSPKEAQVFFLPLLIFATAGGYGTYLLDLTRLSPWLPHIPVINVGLAVKQIILGEGSDLLPVIVAAWMVFYLSLTFWASLRLVRNEKVMLRV